MSRLPQPDAMLHISSLVSAPGSPHTLFSKLLDLADTHPCTRFAVSIFSCSFCRCKLILSAPKGP